MVVEEKLDVAANRHDVGHEEKIETFARQDVALRSPKPWKYDAQQDDESVRIEQNHVTERDDHKLNTTKTWKG